MEAKVRLIFTWKQFSPDLRAYKPSTPVVEVNYSIGIDVPLKHEFLCNSNEIIQAQLSASDEVFPILTPLGMRYVIDQFEAVMVNPDAELQSDESAWDEEETTTKKETSPVVDDEEWEDVPGNADTSSDSDWDESWEE